MNYWITGRVSAQICQDSGFFPAQGFIRLYALSLKLNADISHGPTSNIQIVNEADLANLNGKQVAREPLAADGTYKVTIDPRQQGYEGGPLVAVLEVPYLSPMTGPEKKHPTMFVILERFQPDWNQTDRGISADKSFEIPSSFWCRLMSLFDVWCIYGRVVDCKTQRPLMGLSVTAMDADVIKDDLLGDATTDANGYFKICYRSADFKKTFLSPLINVETPFGGDLGPDVYFIVTSEGNPVYTETRQDGKAKGRKDRPNCWCVTLCFDAGGEVPGDDKDPIRAVWTRVGSLLIPDDSTLQDFDPEGYAGAHKYAFYSVLPLEGVIKRHSETNNPMQWRFLTSSTTTPNGTLAPSAGFSPVNPASGKFQAFPVGEMHRPFDGPYKIVPISITHEDVDADGWVDLEHAIQRTFATDPGGHGISPANLATEFWRFEGGDVMMHLNTGVLTTTHAAPPSFKAGTAVPPGEYYPIEKIAIRFECREVLGGGAFAPSLGNGRTLNSMVVSNDGILAELEAKDNNGNTVYCTSFSDQPKLAYSVYHPHLMGAWLTYRRNGTSTEYSQSGGGVGFSNGPLRPGTTSAGGLVTLVPALTETCIYIATLSYSLRLTTGRNNWTGGPHQAFFYFVA